MTPMTEPTIKHRRREGQMARTRKRFRPFSGKTGNDAVAETEASSPGLSGKATCLTMPS